MNRYIGSVKNVSEETIPPFFGFAIFVKRISTQCNDVVVEDADLLLPHLVFSFYLINTVFKKIAQI